jgi:hypothetical protein
MRIAASCETLGYNRGMSPGRLCALIPALLLTISCSSPVDVKQSVQVTDVSSGWFDAGIVDGANKLVPSVTFRLRDSSGDVSRLAMNIIFKFADNGETHEEIFKQRVDFEGGQTALLTFRAQVGFTGTPPQSRADMLKNSFFRDMDAVVLVRQQSAQWVELHQGRIERQLLTH